MDLSFNQFTKKLIIVSVIWALILYVLSVYLPAHLISTKWPFIIGLFFSITLLVHIYLLKKSSNSHAKFINAFLLTTTVKLLLFFTIIVVYVLLNRNDAIGFILTFFVNYLIFTFFEIFSILKFLRK